MIYQQEISVHTSGRRTYEVTDQLHGIVSASGIKTGLCHVYIMHTSCSLFINENADPSVQYDLNQFLNRLVPENDPAYTHIFEGADDMPAHIKNVLLPVSLGIPIMDGHLALGTWQGIFLWEHRTIPHQRRLIVTLIGD